MYILGHIAILSKRYASWRGAYFCVFLSPTPGFVVEKVILGGINPPPVLPVFDHIFSLLWPRVVYDMWWFSTTYLLSRPIARVRVVVRQSSTSAVDVNVDTY